MAREPVEAMRYDRNGLIGMSRVEVPDPLAKRRQRRLDPEKNVAHRLAHTTPPRRVCGGADERAMRTLIERHLGGLHATLEKSSLRRVDDIASGCPSSIQMHSPPSKR